MKSLLAIVLMFAITSASASYARAGVMVNDIITLSRGVGHHGGIFIVDDLTNAAVPDFPTFCAELEENIFFPPATYRVVGIGVITVTGGKQLMPKAAWLYDRFLSGSLPNFVATNFDDVNTVQFGIWKSLNYTQAQIDAGTNAGFYAYYNNKLNGKGWFTPVVGTYDTQVAANQWSGIGNVRVMNLVGTFNNNRPAQDQLCLVPEPFSAIIWPLIIACIGCGTLRSRRRA